MKLVGILVLLLCSTQTMAQNEVDSTSVEDTEVYFNPEVLPVFPGGMENLKNYLHNNIKYPASSLQKRVEGRVIVRFVVNVDGSVSDAEIVKSVDTDLDMEALRVVKAMPQWKPGMNGGKIVRTQFTIPISFKLNKPTPVKAIVMLTDFYHHYVFGKKPFQLDATKYCTTQFLEKLGKDYEKKLKEDYIISQNEIGLEWWSFFDFITGYQDGPNEINEVIRVVQERDDTYRIYFIENGTEGHRLVDVVERNDSVFINAVYKNN